MKRRSLLKGAGTAGLLSVVGTGAAAAAETAAADGETNWRIVTPNDEISTEPACIPYIEFRECCSDCVNGCVCVCGDNCDDRQL